jgi:SAM-dependent methyltransferase
MTDARDAVKAQYEAWVYPLPIPDIADALNAGLFDLNDPAHCRRKFWPRNVEPAALEILVAGCGTNQAAHCAFTNPESHVVGIDISETSLDHQRLLKEKHQLDNLELRQLAVEQVEDLRQSFDLIISTGVLHHLPDPDRGLRSLRDVLAPHGVMSLMLYGYYGRVGVYMLQEALRLLGSEQDADGLEMVRHILDTIPDWHPTHQYLEIAPDLDYAAGLVDTFLHRSDRAYTVPQVLQFARDNGLRFQAWLDNLNYSLSARVPAEDDMLRQRAETLEKTEQWKLIELLWHLPATHRFLLCHADRPESDYTVDFSGDAWLEYVPSLRPPAQIIVTQVVTTESIDDEPQSVEVSFERNAHTVHLDAFGAAVLELVDGARPIRHILHETSQIGTQAGWDASEHVESARLFFRRMAEWDHFQFEIR